MLQRFVLLLFLPFIIVSLLFQFPPYHKSDQGPHSELSFTHLVTVVARLRAEIIVS